MNSPKALAACVALSLACGACSSTSPLIADKSVLVSPSVEISYEAIAGALVAGVVVWYFADPMAPNWGIQSTKLAEDRYRIDLRQKRFAIGGDGEANQTFHRTAETLAEKNGYTGYTVLSYTEGIDAGPLISQRVSRGVVQLDRALAAER
ncbi:MAG TPA: hypothetical protein VHB46_09530 [Burkholderiales bacterium]|nr:hypothetical protein [Burkholderiales bacterium]